MTFGGGEFQIAKPASWVVLDDLQPAADLCLGNGFREAYLAVVTEPKTELTDTPTLEDYSAESRLAIRESGPAYREEGPRETKIGGFRALEYDLFNSVDGGDFHYRHVSIETPGHFHQIVAWSFESHFSKNADDFQAAIRSFAAAK